jgi:hydroxyacylglutathione hydrolase
MLDVQLIPILNDNYAYLITADNGEVAVVDPGEAGPIIEAIQHGPGRLDTIFNTHHHGDHIGGNARLTAEFGARLVGPEADRGVINGLDKGLKDGDTYSFGGEMLKAIHTPGHTKNHLVLWFPESKILFAGDTLFAMGCGRLFEGDAATMWRSLTKIRDLDMDDIAIYCGHEYTWKNAEFCSQQEPDNEHLQQRYRHVRELRDREQPTLPTTLGEEKVTNTLLRADQSSVKHNLGMDDARPEQVFAELRKRRDVA